MPKNYNDAKAQCESDGTYLAIPRSEAENNFFAGLVPFGTGIWIGINDIEKEGSFVAVDGRPISWTKWTPDQPDNFRGREDAVEIWGKYMYNGYAKSVRNSWNDRRIVHKNQFICSIQIGGKFVIKMGRLNSEKAIFSRADFSFSNGLLSTNFLDWDIF